MILILTVEITVLLLLTIILSVILNKKIKLLNEKIIELESFCGDDLTLSEFTVDYPIE